MASQEYKALLDEAWDLHLRKNAGYAGADNPDPWANFRMCEAFGIPAFEGCMVRLSDKYIRITNLMKDSSNDRVGESVRDTLQDLAAYALIAICLLDEKRAAPPSLGDPYLQAPDPVDSLDPVKDWEATTKCTHCYRWSDKEHLPWCLHHPTYKDTPNPWGDA